MVNNVQFFHWGIEVYQLISLFIFRYTVGSYYPICNRCWAINYYAYGHANYSKGPLGSKIVLNRDGFTQTNLLVQVDDRYSLQGINNGSIINAGWLTSPEVELYKHNQEQKYAQKQDQGQDQKQEQSLFLVIT